MSRLGMRVVGKEALSAEDLAPALEDMKRRLMERNVAEEISVQVCSSVAQSLEGKKLSSFTGGWNSRAEVGKFLGAFCAGVAAAAAAGGVG